MVDEARLEASEYGLTPVGGEWFVVNVADAAWVHNDALGAACIFEGDDVSFPDLGYTIAVPAPGQSGGRYHREGNQEDFLVPQWKPGRPAELTSLFARHTGETGGESG